MLSCKAMTNEAPKLWLVGKPRPVSDGPLRLYERLQALAERDRVEVGQPYLAGELGVTVRTVYSYLETLEAAGCLRRERRQGRETRYYLLVEWEYAVHRLGIVRSGSDNVSTGSEGSEVASDPHNEGFRGGFRRFNAAAARARDTISYPPQPPHPELPVTAGAFDSPDLTVAGFLVKEFAIGDEGVTYRYSLLSEDEQVRWVGKMRRKPPDSPGNPLYAHLLMDQVEVETTQAILGGPSGEAHREPLGAALLDALADSLSEPFEGPWGGAA